MLSTSEIRIIDWGSATITQECWKNVPNYSLRTTERGEKWDYFQTCSLITADTGVDGDIAAHAFVCSFPFCSGCAAWITQLVVRKDMRHKGLATELIAKAWKKDALAWGLMTSHPYAVRALESATRRKCDPRIISLHAKDLIKATCVVGFLLSRNVKSASLKIVL